MRSVIRLDEIALLADGELVAVVSVTKEWSERGVLDDVVGVMGRLRFNHTVNLTSTNRSDHITN